VHRRARGAKASPIAEQDEFAGRFEVRVHAGPLRNGIGAAPVIVPER
jgi:hypothetical protein